jgi:hypothetical protein
MAWKWERRERKQKADRSRMKKSGRSLFIIQRIQQERAEQIKKEREATHG